MERFAGFSSQVLGVHARIASDPATARALVDLLFATHRTSRAVFIDQVVAALEAGDALEAIKLIRIFSAGQGAVFSPAESRQLIKLCDHYKTAPAAQAPPSRFE